MLSTMRLLGQMFTTGVAMLVFAIYIGRVEIVPLYYPLLVKSTQVAFFIFGFLCIAGTFVSLAKGNMRPGNK